MDAVRCPSWMLTVLPVFSALGPYIDLQFSQPRSGSAVVRPAPERASDAATGAGSAGGVIRLIHHNESNMPFEIAFWYCCTV
jgi:hypothetical protein